MNAKIDPAESDEENETGKQNRDQIGSFFVLNILTAEEDDHSVENQNREG